VRARGAACSEQRVQASGACRQAAHPSVSVRNNGSQVVVIASLHWKATVTSPHSDGARVACVANGSVVGGSAGGGWGDTHHVLFAESHHCPSEGTLDRSLGGVCSQSPSLEGDAIFAMWHGSRRGYLTDRTMAHSFPSPDTRASSPESSAHPSSPRHLSRLTT
jgi:hypothetical protein